jgi:hypothetical protein
MSTRLTRARTLDPVLLALLVAGPLLLVPGVLIPAIALGWAPTVFIPLQGVGVALLVGAILWRGAAAHRRRRAALQAVAGAHGWPFEAGPADVLHNGLARLELFRRSAADYRKVLNVMKACPDRRELLLFDYLYGEWTGETGFNRMLTVAACALGDRLPAFRVSTEGIAVEQARAIFQRPEVMAYVERHNWQVESGEGWLVVYLPALTPDSLPAFAAEASAFVEDLLQAAERTRRAAQAEG